MLPWDTCIRGNEELPVSQFAQHSRRHRETCAAIAILTSRSLRGDLGPSPQRSRYQSQPTRWRQWKADELLLVEGS